LQDQNSNFEQTRFQRLLSTTWPLLTAFRVEVRVSWTIAIWPLFFVFAFAQWMTFGEALLWGVAWTLALFTTVWTHEMGHIAMGRRLGIDTRRMTLRGLGGLAHLDSPAQNAHDEIKIALAGPATHLVWMAVLFPLLWVLPDTAKTELAYWMLDGFAWLQLWMMVFNLLPIYPMDGGRVLRGALALKMHPNKASLHAATVGFVGNGLLLLMGILAWLKIWDPLGHGSFGFVLAWIGFAGIQGCRQLRHQAIHGDIYGDDDPFAATLMASRRVMERYDREEAKEKEQRRKRVDERQELQARVDALLGRITEVGGIDHLPARERKELERAAKELSEFD